jgi:hypothetical protein
MRRTVSYIPAAVISMHHAVPTPQLLRDVGQPLSCHAMQAFDLRQDELGVFAVVRETLHHRTEERLREPRRDVECLLNCQFASLLRALDHIPAFLKEVNAHRTGSQRIVSDGHSGK